MVSMKMRSGLVARWLASVTGAMNRAGRALAAGLLALFAAALMAATPSAAQTITSSSGNPNPVVGAGQTVTFVVNFDSGNRVVTSISVDSILGVTYTCMGGIGNGQTNQSVVCNGTYVTTASDVSATQIQERPTVRLMAFSTPVTVVGSVITVAVQAAVTPDVSIAVSPANVAEDGATNLTYTVTRSAASTSSLIVNLTTSGTATSGTDYSGGVSTVTIPANATTATVTLNPTADATIETARP